MKMSHNVHVSAKKALHEGPIKFMERKMTYSCNVIGVTENIEKEFDVEIAWHPVDIKVSDISVTGLDAEDVPSDVHFNSVTGKIHVTNNGQETTYDVTPEDIAELGRLTAIGSPCFPGSLLVDVGLKGYSLP